MTSIVLKKQDTRWVAEVDGMLHAFRISSLDNMSSFRSIGVHPKGAVMFDCDISGDVNDVKLIQGGQEIALLELPIPATHTLSRQIDLGNVVQ